MGIDELLNWMVARMPIWQGRLMGVPPAEAEALVVRAKRVYVEQLVCEPYPRHTPIAARITEARGDAMGFLVNY